MKKEMVASSSTSAVVASMKRERERERERGGCVGDDGLLGHWGFPGIPRLHKTVAARIQAH